MRFRACLPALAAAMVFTTSLRAGAGDRPTVSVLPFEINSLRLDGSAIADELASRLIDSNRFRVLPREWLPAPAARRSIAAYRAAAGQAGVQFLLAGAVSASQPRGLPTLRASSARPIVVYLKAIAVSSGVVVRTSSARAEVPVFQSMPSRGVSNPLVTLALAGARHHASSSADTAAVVRAVASIARTFDLSDVVIR